MRPPSRQATGRRVILAVGLLAPGLPAPGLLAPGLLAIAQAMSGARAATLVVGVGRFEADGRPAPPELAAVDWSRVAPGDEIIVAGDRSTHAAIVHAKGTAAQPILIHAEAGAIPLFENSIVLDGASFVVIDSLTVENTPQAAFIVRGHSDHITIQRSTARNSQLGIWIGEESGVGDRILGNVVSGNSTHGIAIYLADATAADRTLISGNQVMRNNIHGVEITGSYYTIEHNDVFENGQTVSGSSGIHLYSPGPAVPTCSYNIIRYNMSYRNIEKSNQDGNGIQIDQWCNYNQVYYNLAFGNDGAGIMLFDASYNRVINNTVFGNMLDPGHSHAYRGELVLASDYTHNVDANAQNTIENNVLVTNSADNVAIYVDKYAGRHPQEVGGNVMANLANGPVYFQSGAIGQDPGTWNSVKPGSHPDFFADPKFSNPGLPEAGGLRAAAPSVIAAKGLAVGLSPDFAGTTVPQNRNPDAGAYQTTQ